MAIEEILDLEQLEVNIYRGGVFSPESGFLQRTFGGHVAGQSLVSAVRTVDPNASRCTRCTATSCGRAMPGRRRCSSSSASATAARSAPGGSARSSTARRSSRCRRRSRPTRAASSTRTRCRRRRRRTTCRISSRAGVRRRRLPRSSTSGTFAIVPREAGAPARQGFPAAGVVPPPRPAARRPGAAHLRAGLHERPDAAGLGAGQPPRGAQAPDGRVAGPRDVVHAAVPRRRMAALRPVLAVGVRGPRR